MKNSHHFSFFVHSLTGGGAERMFANLANAFADRGHNVDLVLVDARGPYLDNIDDSVSVYEIGGDAVFRIVPNLVRYLRVNRPTSIISTNEKMNITASLAVNFAMVDTQVINRVSSINSWNDRSSLKQKLVPAFQTLSYLLADGIVAISNDVKKDIVSKHHINPDKITVIYNPVFTPEIIERARESPDHPWFYESDPIILGVGRLEPVKDFKTLIRAVARLNGDQSPRLVTLGEGSERENLLALADSLGVAHRITFPGFVSNPYSYMRAADVFVLSSKVEGFGNVLVEAMATGTSIVATDCPGGPSEILGGGEFGRLVPVGDDEKMAQKVLESLEDPVCSELLKKRAEEFNLEAAMDQYKRILTRG